jgi:hypothetical protein
MDSIDKVIEYCETGTKAEYERNEDGIVRGPERIYEAIDRLRSSNTYYFLQWWISAKEFQRSKLTRSNFIPKMAGDDSESKIEIIVHENKPNDLENENANDSGVSEDS